MPCLLGCWSQINFPNAFLAVFLLSGDLDNQRMSLLALAIGTASFFWRLFPLIRKMDKSGQIEPKDYSIALGVIFIQLLVFSLNATIRFGSG